MTAFISSSGQFEPFVFNLTGTGNVTIATSDNSRHFQIESLIAAATGTADFTLWVDKGGGTTVNIIPAVTLNAKGMHQLINHPLRILPGWSLVCKASVGNIIGVTASLLMISKQPEKLATL